jgi:hypothetical protein
VADELQTSVGDLKALVVRVVRTATPEVDRRGSPRYIVDLPCTLTMSGAGTAAGRLLDLSEGGARVQSGTAMPLGAAGTLQIDGFGSALPFTIRDVKPDGARLMFQPDDAQKAELRSALERLALRRAA